MDVTSGSNNLIEYNAKRAKAIKKASYISRGRARLVILLIWAVVGLHQYLEYKNTVNAKRDGENFSNYYLNLNIDGLSWADILYGAALFFPALRVVNTVDIVPHFNQYWSTHA